MFPASVKKLRPAFEGGADGIVGASRRRWPPCRDIVKKVKEACNVPGFAVGGGAWRQGDGAGCESGWRRLDFSCSPSTTFKIAQTILRPLHGFPEAQRLRDVRPKAGESGNNLPIQSALRMSIILRSSGAFWIFGPAPPPAQSLRFRQRFRQWRLYDLPASTAATYRFATSLMVC